MSIDEINKMLKDKNISPELRIALEIKKNAIENNKIVKK